VNREAGAPYKRIAAALRADIEADRLRPGEQVPSLTKLCETYGVSRNTALRAIRVLADEGLIRTEQGWGSFVATPPDEKQD
jgi:DNA-binding GntR family transcriptional regulator